MDDKAWHLYGHAFAALTAGFLVLALINNAIWTAGKERASRRFIAQKGLRHHARMKACLLVPGGAAQVLATYLLNLPPAWYALGVVLLGAGVMPLAFIPDDRETPPRVDLSEPSLASAARRRRSLSVFWLLFLIAWCFAWLPNASA